MRLPEKIFESSEVTDEEIRAIVSSWVPTAAMPFALAPTVPKKMYGNDVKIPEYRSLKFDKIPDDPPKATPNKSAQPSRRRIRYEDLPE